MADAEKKEFLRRTPIFAGMSDEELDEIVPLMVERRLRKNTVIFHEGDPASAFYMVKAGRVKVFKGSADGREQVLAIMGDGGPYPATAATMNDSTIYLIPREDLLAVVRRHPEIAVKVIAVLGQRLRQALELVRDLSFKQVPHRLAGLLLKLAREYGQDGDGGILIDMSLPRQEIADIVGTSRETVTRELKKMEKAGLISIERRYITITDPDKLTSWARL
jgi:CRP/FNR family cyclic AMP-dependent transcriptional regulator